jgi:carbonic anhydrase
MAQAHDSRIQLLVDCMQPDLANLGQRRDAEAISSQAVEANVRWSIRQILETPEGRERTAIAELKLVGAIYQIESGRVRFLQ